MSKQKVLFVCIHNSARSQMAEAWLNHLCKDCFEAQSAGIEPGRLNPLVVEVMKQEGIDISHKTTKAVFDIFKKGERFDYVITVCDEASAERCPVFPGLTQRLHWSFPDPSKATGSDQEKIQQIRPVCNAIKLKIENWCAKACSTADKS